MKTLVTFSRILVGSLFLVSGLIKANDPLGFSYKLEEYFEVSALNLPFLEPWALAIGILVCVGEIVLALAVLFGGKMKLATWSLLLMTVFFGWLTSYTATCDPQGTYTIMVDGAEVEQTVTCVADCGCFGDAMKGSIGRSLTPWESFYKDLILFIFIIPIFLARGSISLNTDDEDKVYLIGALIGVGFFSWVFTWYFPVLFLIIGFAGHFGIKRLMKEGLKEWSIAAYATLIATVFAYHCYANLPMRDYRPYGEGKSIVEQMKSCDELGLPCPELGYIYSFKNLKTGEVIKKSDKLYIAEKFWENKEWEMLTGDADTESVVYKAGYEQVIMDFQIFDQQDNDMTGQILDADYAFLLISYDISKSDLRAREAINNFVTKSDAAGIMFKGVSASLYDEVEDYRHENQHAFEYYVADGITLKTIIRSSPGLVLIKKGVVAGKWHFNNFPTFDEVKRAHFN